jgi:hypothetical protein
VLVATGLPRLALVAAGVVAPAIDPLNAGPLADHLYIYVPVPLQSAASAVDLFSASVVAQCAHYAAVILVLPALLAAGDPDARGLVAWPRGRLFVTSLAVLSSLALYRFAGGFVSARSLYGIAASLHAWVEIPLVVIAVTRTRHANRAIPISVEAPLANAESASDRLAESPVAQMTIAASATMTTASAPATAGQKPMRG